MSSLPWCVSIYPDVSCVVSMFSSFRFSLKLSGECRDCNYNINQIRSGMMFMAPCASNVFTKCNMRLILRTT